MFPESDLSKAQRLQLIRDFLYSQSPQSVSSSDIARRFGLTRSGALKNLRSASEIWPEIEQKEDRGWHFRPDSRLIEVSLTTEEAQVLHLASRLFARLIPRPFRDSRSALQKLAAACGKASPVLARLITETAESLPEEKKNDPYTILLDRIYQAMEENLSLRIQYRKKDGSSGSYHLVPLFLEPYGDGRSLYLFARDLDRGRFFSLKTEHLLEVRLGSPGGIEGPRESSITDSWRKELNEELADSWGIWRSDLPPERVVLFFSKESAVRIRETLWHSNQILKDREEGLIWEARIASPMEMYPWIRSWGPDVQILEPEWLRELMQKDLEEMLGNYRKS